MNPAISNSLFEPSQFPAYTVRLDSFEGPLDLLLHLIKKNEVEICDIQISTITRQYIEYIELMKELNLEIAGEFLVMASTLIQIKSKMLLPVVEDEVADADEEQDPRMELIKRLLDYQRYKDASSLISAREILGRDVFKAIKSDDIEFDDIEPNELFIELDMIDLVEALRQVLVKIPFGAFHEVVNETINVADQINRILDLLEGVDSILFDDLFDIETLNREIIIATFLALLELCKLKAVKVVQSEPFGAIFIILTSLNKSDENNNVCT